jgi:hypothetical protein
MVAAAREVGDQVGEVKEVAGQEGVGWVVEVVMVVVGQAVEERVVGVREEEVEMEVGVKVVRAEVDQEEGKEVVGAQGKMHPGLCLLWR